MFFIHIINIKPLFNRKDWGMIKSILKANRLPYSSVAYDSYYKGATDTQVFTFLELTLRINQNLL